MHTAPREASARMNTIFELLLPEFGNRVTRGTALREQHSRGEGILDSRLPDMVVFPTSNDEVRSIVALCDRHAVPIIPFGAGTSLEGHVASVKGGVCVDMSRMNQILSVSSDAMDCRVQAGVTRKRLNEELRTTGLFFSVDPGADATVGGMVATRASGTTAVRYGTMRQNVMGLTVVTPNGHIIRTGTRARKSASGLDLTSIYIGSEGILGIITEIQLRLHAIPESTIAAVCQFPTIQAAMATVFAVLQSGIAISRIELANKMQMHISIRHFHLNEYEEEPTLFLEFAGSSSAVQAEANLIQELATALGGSRFTYAVKPEDQSRLWKARHMAYYANLAYIPGKNVMGTDACVPISALAECILQTEEDIERSGLIAPLVGHVGDGNFHLGILFNPDDADERDRADGVARRVGERAIAFGGTCSGEHGIGLHKRELATIEHGESAGVMWAIKRALDPKGIMNPGKLLPLTRDDL